MNFISNLRISHRIFIGFGLITAIVMAIGLKAIWSVTTLDKGFTEFAKHGDALAAASQISRNFANMHAVAEQYYVAPSDKRLSSVNTAHGELIAQIDDKLKKIEIEKDRKLLKDARHLIDEYWSAFEESVVDRREQARIVDDELHKTGDALQKEITEIYKHIRSNEKKSGAQNPASPIVLDAMIHILIARDHANRFVYGHDIKEMDYALSELDRVQKDLTTDEMATLPAADQKLIKDAVHHLDEYRGALTHYLKLDKHAKELHNEVMVNDTALIIAALTEIEELATTAEHEIGDRVHSEAAAAITLSSVGLFIALSVAIGLSIIIGRMISVPIRRISSAMLDISNGKLDTEVPHVAGKNEMSEIADALKIFYQSLIERAELQRTQAEEQEAKQRRQDEINQLVGIFGKSIRGVFERVSGSSAHMSETASGLLENANATSHQASVLSGEAEETASTVTTVSSAAEELSASIGEIQRRVGQSAELSSEAMAGTEETKKSFEKLLEASGQITGVVELIMEIADQTNLLALNATIEAARAGEAGKGFAVVASEVKELAAQTAKATGSISSQVNAVRSTAEDAKISVEKINTTIAELHEYSESISEAVSQQQLATSEIAESVETVATSTQRVSESVTEVSGSADQGRTGADEVKLSAGEVLQEADLLSSEVETFLSALQDQGNEGTFQIHSVDLPASVEVDGTSRSCRVTMISAAAAHIDVALVERPGARVSVRLANSDKPILARLADVQGTTSQLQFPLNHEHIAEMSEKIANLVSKKAA